VALVVFFDSFYALLLKFDTNNVNGFCLLTGSTFLLLTHMSPPHHGLRIDAVVSAKS
jgi:hypothetical protein